MHHTCPHRLCDDHEWHTSYMNCFVTGDQFCKNFSLGLGWNILRGVSRQLYERISGTICWYYGIHIGIYYIDYINQQILSIIIARTP